MIIGDREPGRLLVAVLFAALAPACLGDPETAASASQSAANRSGSLADGPGVKVDIVAEATACVASVQCRPALLPSPDGSARVPTLTTGLACSYSPMSGPLPRDSLLLFARRLRCHDAGDPADPGTWSPREGVEVDPLAHGEEGYGLVIPPYGDVSLGSASRLDAATGWAFCRYEAWGTLAGAADDGGPRGVEHASGALAIHWSLDLVPQGAGGGGEVQCLATTPVERVRVASATRDVPEPAAAQALPALTDAALVLEDTLVTDVAGTPITHAGLRLIALLDAPFPPSPVDPLGGFLERALWVSDGRAPLDIAVSRSCANVDGATGLLASIALQVSDLDGTILGGVLVHADLGAERFECERGRLGECALLSPAELDQAAPCLTIAAP